MLLVNLFSFHSTLHSENPEKYFFSIDRTIYVAGESMHFCFSDMLQNKSRSKSKVVYIEMFNEYGDVIVQKIFEIINGKATGEIFIPTGANSGAYVIRAYTNLMRNVNAEIYNNICLTILNHNNSIPSKTIIGRDSVIKYIIDNQVDSCRVRQQFFTSLPKIPNITWVSASMAPEIAGKGGCVSVTNDYGSVTEEKYSIESTYPLLEGKVEKKSESISFSEVKLFLSIIGNNPLVLVSKVDTNGTFRFKLPYYSGNYILVLSSNVPGLKIYTNTIFDIRPPVFPEFLMANLDSISGKYLKSLLINAQINYRFLKAENSTYSSYMFYDEPDKKVILDDYVSLPTLEEYFYELDLNVFIKKNDGLKQFRIFDPIKNRVDDIYEPLVMVDNVYYPDIESILTLNPIEVDRIETINSTYRIGDYTFSGVINILTRNRNLANIQLPNTALVLSHPFFTENNPGFNILKGQINNTIPLLNNTIYWSGNLSQVGNQLSFITGDATGDFIFSIHGYDRDFQPIIFRKKVNIYH